MRVPFHGTSNLSAVVLLATPCHNSPAISCPALLQGLAALKRRYGFLLAVDEAHATLVCGSGGGGAAEMMGVGDDVDVHIGTLSKAVGAQVRAAAVAAAAAAAGGGGACVD
jgi:glutamate-1-semialdehyde aminotransferase